MNFHRLSLEDRRTALLRAVALAPLNRTALARAVGVHNPQDGAFGRALHFAMKSRKVGLLGIVRCCLCNKVKCQCEGRPRPFARRKEYLALGHAQRLTGFKRGLGAGLAIPKTGQLVLDEVFSVVKLTADGVVIDGH